MLSPRFIPEFLFYIQSAVRVLYLLLPNSFEFLTHAQHEMSSRLAEQSLLSSSWFI